MLVDPICSIIIILMVSVCSVLFCRLLNASSIVGYLFAGFLIKSNLFGELGEFAINKDVIYSIGEIGILFLMFFIGLKMPLRRFQALKKYILGLGSLQVFITILLCIIIIYCILNLQIVSAISIACVLTLSSTAVGLQLLAEKGELAQQYGRVSFAILLAQDLTVVLLMVALSTFGAGANPLQFVGTALINTAFLALLVAIASKVILPPLMRIIVPLKSAEILTATSILIVLLTSIGASESGLSKELGAFIAGIILSGSEYRHQVEADIQPFYGFLVGMFFVSIGMKLDYLFIKNNFSTIMLTLTSMILFKGMIIFILCKLFKLTGVIAFRVSLLLSGGGEFAFVLLKPIIEKNFLSPEFVEILYAVVALSMILTPILVIIGKWMIDKTGLSDNDANYIGLKVNPEELDNHVIVAGFGRTGKMVCRLLEERLIQFIAIDKNMDRVLEGRARGIPVFYGNPIKESIWKSLGAEKSKIILINLSSPKDTLRTALMLNRKYQGADICARIDDKEYEKKMNKVNITVIKPEIFEPSIPLVSKILEKYGTPKEESLQIIEKFHRLYLGDYAKEFIEKQ